MNQPTREDVGAVGESFGARLREAREGAGLALEDAAARLHMPVANLRALEQDDWERAGAPIFVRGQLRRYAGFLGVEPDLEQVERQLEGLSPPPLVSHSHVPRYRRMFEQATRRAMYIAITAVIAVPVWLTTQPHLSNDVEVRSLDVEPVVQAPGDPVRDMRPDERAAPVPPGRTPVLASIGGMRASATESRPLAAPPVVEGELALSFHGESWMEVSAPDGSVVEKALLGEGETRRYSFDEVGEVVLGNVAAVEVRSEGEPVDLAAFARANVARFALSSDGSLQARAD